MSITRELVDLLNYFTCPITAHWEPLEFDVVWRFASPDALSSATPPPLDYDTGLEIKNVPAYGDFCRTIEDIRKSVSLSRSALKKLLAGIVSVEQSLHEQCEQEPGDVVEHHVRARALDRSWYHFSEFGRHFDTLEMLLDLQLIDSASFEEWKEEARKAPPLYKEARALQRKLQPVWQALLLAIRAKDAAFQRRRARMYAADRLSKRAFHGLKPTRTDWEATRRDAAENLRCALGPLNLYLDNQNANFRLGLGHIHVGFDDDSAWRQACKRDPFELQSLAFKHRALAGQPLSGITGTLVVPIVDYLVDPDPLVRLGLCENPLCGCSFIRKPTAVNRKFCSDQCRRDAA